MSRGVHFSLPSFRDSGSRGWGFRVWEGVEAKVAVVLGFRV